MVSGTGANLLVVNYHPRDSHIKDRLSSIEIGTFDRLYACRIAETAIL
jgi:hypothetical protein